MSTLDGPKREQQALELLKIIPILSEIDEKIPGSGEMLSTIVSMTVDTGKKITSARLALSLSKEKIDQLPEGQEKERLLKMYEDLLSDIEEGRPLDPDEAFDQTYAEMKQRLESMYDFQQVAPGKVKDIQIKRLIEAIEKDRSEVAYFVPSVRERKGVLVYFNQSHHLSANNTFFSIDDESIESQKNIYTSLEAISSANPNLSIHFFGENLPNPNSKLGAGALNVDEEDSKAAKYDGLVRFYQKHKGQHGYSYSGSDEMATSAENILSERVLREGSRPMGLHRVGIDDIFAADSAGEQANKRKSDLYVMIRGSDHELPTDLSRPFLQMSHLLALEGFDVIVVDTY